MTAALVAQPVLALVAVLAAVATPARHRGVAAGGAAALTAAAGAWAGMLALGGATGALEIPTALPGVVLRLAPDRLGGLFMLVAGVVGAAVAVYAIGYAHGTTASRTQWAALPVFLLGMQLVPAAADVVTFLLAWELMAGGSTVLVLAEQSRRGQTREAALWYAVTTHLSMLAILGGFAVLAAQTGAIDFAGLAAADPRSGAASLAFVLLAVGFGTKAGVVPLHVWLPRAHPEAPSHASAAMSAAMVKMGVYGLLLVTLRLLPGGPTWWAGVLVGVGALSAVYGILQAAVASDLKRLLAYSTSENVGLIVLALGMALLLRDEANAPASLALLACLLLVVSHAAFKTTLFLGAGAVLHATGERDLDRLGGLVHRMPWTAAAFGLGALGAAALPITGGFVAEWTLLQAMIHAAEPGQRVVAATVPLALGVVALTAGLALLTFVKAFGIAFLARPRSLGAQTAREAPVAMRVAMVVSAVAVIGLGVAPGPVASGLARAVGIPGVGSAGLGGVTLDGVGAVLDPVALAALSVAVAVPVVLWSAVLVRRHPRVVDAPAWGCGRIRTSPRMQYTATSYAEPLMRVFDDALQPTRDIEVTHVAESQYLADRVQYSQRVDDVIEVRLYAPVVRVANRVADAARRVQNGSITRYLAFAFAALVVALVVVSW